MVKEQYDQIAEQYKDAERTVEGIHVVRPTFLKLCGVHVPQRSVLDLACGSGIYTRVLKEAGAKRVVGIDISEEQIKIARRTEMNNPLGIEYFVGDAGTYDFVKRGSFDVVTAVFLLEYASSREGLQQICRNVYLALRAGGIFITIIDNPDAILPTDKKYEVVLSLDEGSSGEEGCKRRVTFYRDGVEVLHVYNYLWSRGTYEGALRNAGFHGIRWRNPVVSEAGMQIFGESFWANFLENSNPIVLECRK
jgi:SAM-dependent methyltransferase